jgi:hypothetical protein
MSDTAHIAALQSLLRANSARIHALSTLNTHLAYSAALQEGLIARFRTELGPLAGEADMTSMQTISTPNNTTLDNSRYPQLITKPTPFYILACTIPPLHLRFVIQGYKE